jgi:hypothetical protein
MTVFQFINYAVHSVTGTSQRHHTAARTDEIRVLFEFTASVLINRDYVMILTDHHPALPNMQYEMYVLIHLALNKHAACGATTWLQTELLVSGSKQWYLC